MKPYGWLLILMSISFIAVPRAVEAKEVYIFSAPPRESYEDGMKQYGAIADYLSKVTGKKIQYVHQTNWLSYMKDMAEGRFDIAFDGPHFNVWRNRYLGHDPVVRIDNLKGGTFKPKWLLVYRKGTWGGDMSTLPGKTFCLHAPPNFGTMSVFHLLFPNPARQPYIKEMKGWKKMVNAVRDNKNGCEFTVSRGKHVKGADPDGKKLGRTAIAAYPHQGFTISSAMPEATKEAIKAALVSDEFRIAARAFFKRFVGREDRGLVVYKDSPKYDEPFDILAQQYLIPWSLHSSVRVAATP